MFSWLSGKRKSKPPVSSSEQEDRALAEASQQILAKRSKLGVAQEAILTRDLAELAVADRQKVRQLEERVLGMSPSPKSDDPVGDIIVCDDYSVNRQTGISRPMGLALAGLTGLASAGALWYALRDPARPEPKADTAVTVPATAPGPVMLPAAKLYEWWEIKETKQPDGTWKETGRTKLRSRADGTIEAVK